MENPRNRSASRAMMRGQRNFPARIVLLLEELNFGGTQRQAVELALNMDPSRFAVEIWMMAAGEAMAPLARKGNIPLVWLANRSYVGPDSLLRLWQRLKTSHIDMLVLMTVIPNIWGRLLGRSAGVPTIVGTCRGNGSAFRQHEKVLWPLADHHLCNAGALERQLTRDYRVPDSLVSVIPNGVNTDFFLPPKEGRKDNRKVALCLARLVPEKDHETLIAAFGLVAARHPEAELWVVGDGPRRARIEKLAARTIPTGRFRLLSSQLDLRPLFVQSSLLVLSSIEEGLPNVVLEAMASGLPVVATSVGGLPEVVEHGRTGWLVPKQNVPALAEALVQLLCDEKTRAAFGEAGRRRTEECYSIPVMVRRHEEVFQNLLNAQDELCGNGAKTSGKLFSWMKWSSRA